MSYHDLSDDAPANPELSRMKYRKRGQRERNMYDTLSGKKLFEPTKEFPIGRCWYEQPDDLCRLPPGRYIHIRTENGKKTQNKIGRLENGDVEIYRGFGQVHWGRPYVTDDVCDALELAGRVRKGQLFPITRHRMRNYIRELTGTQTQSSAPV